MTLSGEKLLLAAGMIYILGLMTPVLLLKLTLKSPEDGCFFNCILLLLAVPFGALLVAFAT